MNIVRGTPHTVDAGLFNTSYFSYVASFGAFTETSYSTPQNFKNALGHLAIFLRASKRFRHLHPIRSVWKRMDRFIKIPIFSVQSAMPEVWGDFEDQ